MVCVTRDRLAVNWCAAREKIQNVSRKSIQNESMDNQTEYVIVILTANIQKTVAQIMKKLKDCVTVSFWFFNLSFPIINYKVFKIFENVFYLKVQSCKLKKHRQMMAYVFQKYSENYAL